MSKPFTYWVRLALVATMCTLVTFSPVSAGRWMDRLLHRDACKALAKDNCASVNSCEPTCVAPPAACFNQPAPCDSQPASNCVTVVTIPAASAGCHSSPPSPCDCDTGIVAAPVAQSPAPVVQNPAPVVQNPAPVVQNPAPVVQNPAPVVQTPAPVVQKPAPVVQKPAPAVQTPAPVVQTPAPVVQTPAPITIAPPIEKPTPTPTVVEDAQPATVPNPFDTPITKQPVEAAPATIPTVDDLFLDTPPAKKPAIEPEMPAKEPAQTDLDDIFGSEPTKSAPVEPDPVIQNQSLDNLFDPPESKPALPEIEAPIADKPADPNVDDLFGQPEKTPAPAPASDPSINELFGKPIATEIDSSKEMPKSSTDENESSIEDLFGTNSAIETPSDPEQAETEQLASETIILPTFAEPTFAEPVIETPVIETPVIEEAVIEETPHTDPAPIEPAIQAPSIPPAKAKAPVDDLDALFGIGAYSSESEFKGAEFRQWVDNSGTYRVNARLVIIYVDKIKLLKENGKVTTVPLSRLSDADFGYVSWVAANLTNEQTARMVKSEKAKDSEVDRK